MKLSKWSKCQNGPDPKPLLPFRLGALTEMIKIPKIVKQSRKAPKILKNPKNSEKFPYDSQKSQKSKKKNPKIYSKGSAEKKKKIHIS